MFSRSRRTEGPYGRRPGGEAESDDDQLSVPCRVKVVTRGLALIIALMGIILVCQSQSSSPAVPVPFATCDGLQGFVKALARPADDRTNYACISNGRLTFWNPHFSHARVGASQGAHISGAVFAPDGARLAVMDCHGVVSLWDLATWRRRAEIPPRTAWPRRWHSVATVPPWPQPTAPASGSGT